MAISIAKFVLRFVEEAREHLTRMGDGFASLEKGVFDPELINSLFRSAHTVKGSSRMVKLDTITETAHRMEDILGAMRDGTLSFSPELGQLLYRSIDTISQMVDCAAEKPEAPELPPIDEQLCKALANMLSRESVPNSIELAEPPALNLQKPIPEAVAPLVSVEPKAVVTPTVAVEPRLKTSETVRVRLAKLDELIKLMGEVISSHARMRQRLMELQHLEHVVDNVSPDGKQMLSLHSFARAFKDDVQSQHLLMNELHDKALLMRMLPLAMVFEPVARMVRDLARTLGKQVECNISGAEIELDRQMIDLLSDPLLHLLRNALDHGIEMPQQRIEAGKPPQGQICLNARQDGIWVLLEVSDNGKGIDPDMVRDKAIRKGLLTEEAASSMTREDIIDLIFLPGFSTSTIITDLSGRGVGMDVVKRCIVDDLQGTVTVESRPGQGSSFVLRLPLSLAMMRVLLVMVEGLPFGFTSQHLAALLRVPQSALMTITAGRSAVVLENEFVPVVPLAALVRIPAHQTRNDTYRNLKRPGLLLVVLQVRNEKLALLIDELLDECDMVIKPMPKHLRQLDLVSGMVVTGKSELVNVLHAPALLELARRLQMTASVINREVSLPSVSRNNRLLVVDDSISTREIVKDMLEACGYQVTLAEDGLEGLGKAMAEPFDAILTDVEMPNMDGFTLTARLREEERYSSVPILIITSREREEDKRRGIEAGADAYIVKSNFEQSSLVDTLQALLG